MEAVEEKVGVTPNDLGHLIRDNAEEALTLAKHMEAWSCLRAVLTGDAPPPVLYLELPIPGTSGDNMTRLDLGSLSLEEAADVLVPIANILGNSVVSTCRAQADKTDRMVNICEALLAAHQPPPEPAGQAEAPEYPRPARKGK